MNPNPNSQDAGAQAQADALREAVLEAREWIAGLGPAPYALAHGAKEMIEWLDAALAGSLPAVQQPGFVLVPVEPTPEMVRAGASVVARMVGDPYDAWNHFTEEAKRVHGAMLAAAQPKARVHG